jgi:hypothetical protein
MSEHAGLVMKERRHGDSDLASDLEVDARRNDIKNNTRRVIETSAVSNFE